MNTDDRQPIDHKNVLQQALHDDERAPSWQAPALDVIAEHFPELVIEDLVGQGGMAAVYRAVQKRLDRRVALKVLRPDLAKQPEFVTRFMREAKALAQLNNPHVLAVHDFGERAGFCYLLLEFVDGANLRELTELGRLSPAEALRIVPQICAGLQFAHDHGIVHRDIKPENVLVDRHGQVKLADFGLAKLADGGSQAHLTRASMVFGTPHYMAPEQWRGSAAVDHRADIYSLGVVLYELLTGKLPIGTYAPASSSAGVPGGIDRVVHRSLEQEPERRYQSAREVQRDIEHESKGMAAAATSKPVAAARSLVGRGWALLATAATMLVVSSFGMLVFDAMQRERWLGREIAVQASQRNEDRLRAIHEVVTRGEAWTGLVPTFAEFGVADEVAPLLRWSLLSAWGIGTAAFVALLLVAAARCARANASRQQWLSIVVVACLPVVVPVDLWLLMQGRENPIARVFAGGFVLLSNLIILRWLWDRTAGMQPVVTPATTLRFRLAMAAAFLSVLGSAGGAVAAHLASAERTALVARAPMRADQLSGKTRNEVLTLLGPPVTVSANAASQTWSYRVLDGIVDGVLTPGQLILQAERVIATDGGQRLLLPEPMPADVVHLGMSVDGATRLLGAVVEKHEGQGATQLTFGDGTVLMVSQGVVVGIQRR